MNKIKVNIQGKRINYFLRKIIDNKIEIFNIIYISDTEINIIINKNDYIKIKKIKTIYKIRIVEEYGLLNIKNKLKNNYILLIFLIVGITVLFILSNIIFSIKVIHNDEEIRDLIYNELKINGIKIHGFKKNKKEIDKIKSKILLEYKDKIEWLEIENIGISYIVKLQARIIPKNNEELANRNVIAKKNAVIKKIEAITGNIEKQRGEYVKKGDVIINGNIMLNENVKGIIPAKGIVYGEVWYTINISYPYIYQEQKSTNNKSLNIIFNFLNNKKYLYGKKYKYSKNNLKKEYKSTFLPIYLSFEENVELNKIDYILTCDQAINKAIDKGKKQMKNRLGKDEYIISSKILSTKCDTSSASLQIFYTVYENITDYQIIN